MDPQYLKQIEEACRHKAKELEYALNVISNDPETALETFRHVAKESNEFSGWLADLLQVAKLSRTIDMHSVVSE